MILNLYKKEGETPLQRIIRFKAENPSLQNEKMTYAGRLDPMAEGVLVVLSGEEIYKKDDFLKLDKIYQFEVLWGTSSDTYDILGEVTVSSGAPSEQILKEDAGSFVGTVEIPYPAYSSRTVLGQPLWSYARSGQLEEIEFPKRSMNIIELSYDGSKNITSKLLLENVKKRISQIEGDFRQELIMETWKNEVKKSKLVDFRLSAFTARVASGTYIRSLAVRMGEKYNLRALAWSIKRTAVGDFKIEDSV